MRRIVFRLLRFTGLPFFLREWIQRRRTTILCYHDPRPADCEKHLELLSRTYNIISLRRYLEWRKDPTVPLPPKSLVLTFDDGHRGNYQLRHVLSRYKVPVTIFLCSGIVGSFRHFWWKEVTRSECELLKRVSDARRLAMLSRRGFAEPLQYSEPHALSVSEIKAMTSLVDFQSHTRFHPILPRCTDARATEEIAGSRTELMHRFGFYIYAFAYPNGDYADRDVELVRRAGYECALTVDAGYNGKNTDLFRLRRIAIPDDASVDELMVKTSGIWGLWERWIGQAGRAGRKESDSKEIVGHGSPEAEVN